MNKVTKHLYIHIPFCKHICHYCDFARIKVDTNHTCIKEYLKKIYKQIINESIDNQYISIYIGGGTPNMLCDDDLNQLLSLCSKYLDYSENNEFCIELNPEFVTESQVSILKNNGINRVSIGVQTTNNKILKELNRKHTIEDAVSAIEKLYTAGIYNISCDFIYALPNLTLKDIDHAIEFIDQLQIHHVSFYALEVKEGTYFNHINYEVDEDEEAKQLEYIDQKLKGIGLDRYEVSNWSKDEESQSIHNKAYWLTNDWKAIGWGSSGMEDRVLYKYEGNFNNFYKVEKKTTIAEYYLQVLMMGLRLINGIDVINNKRNAAAYEMYFNDIVNCRIRNGYLQCRNINLLHESLVNMVDETKLDQLENSKNKSNI